MARPERFELPTPRFVDWSGTLISLAYSTNGHSQWVLAINRLAGGLQTAILVGFPIEIVGFLDKGEALLLRGAPCAPLRARVEERACTTSATTTSLKSTVGAMRRIGITALLRFCGHRTCRDSISFRSQARKRALVSSEPLSSPIRRGGIDTEFLVSHNAGFCGLACSS